MLGAARLFDDAWLDKEDNSRINDFVFKWLRPVRFLTLSHTASACQSAFTRFLCTHEQLRLLESAAAVIA